MAVKFPRNLNRVTVGSGVPTDSLYDGTPEDGQQFVDQVAGTLYVRVQGSWHAPSAGGSGIGDNFIQLGLATTPTATNTPTPLTWTVQRTHGTPGWGLNVDNQTLTCAVAGQYVVFIKEIIFVNNAAAEETIRCAVVTTNVSDNTALWTHLNMQLDVPVISTNGAVWDYLTGTYTSPPCAFSVGDAFTVDLSYDNLVNDGGVTLYQTSSLVISKVG